MAVESWGRFPRVAAHSVALADGNAELPRAGRPLLAYGLGRSYGDACLVDDGGTQLLMRGCSRILDIDAARGVIRCEAGASLGEVIEASLPRGWFPAVVPGTRFVTVGGAIANDIHGKNHHAVGTFGAHVRSFDLRRTDGSLLHCSATTNEGLFRATIGGLGMTGVIVRAELQLAPVASGTIERTTTPFGSLREFLVLSDAADSHPFTVGWLDCMAPARARGRGVLFLGRHGAGRSRVRPPRSMPAVPFTMPEWLLNRMTSRAFNAAYRLAHRSPGRRAVHHETFFFPLDAVPRWNLLYGPAGFVQWQCVVPTADAVPALEEVLARIGRSGHDAYLGVVKKFGDLVSPGMLSFPRPGVTLAVDFPIHGPRTFALLDTLDDVVRAAGGALYAAKDARMSPAMFRRSNPRLEEFLPWRDPGIRSRLWARLAEAGAP